MRGPCAIEGNESSGIYGATEYVFWDEFPLVPDKYLVICRIRSVLSFSDSKEPFPIRVVAVLEPFVDERVCRIMVKRLDD